MTLAVFRLCVTDSETWDPLSSREPMIGRLPEATGACSLQATLNGFESWDPLTRWEPMIGIKPDAAGACSLQAT